MSCEGVVETSLQQGISSRAVLSGGVIFDVGEFDSVAAADGASDSDNDESADGSGGGGASSSYFKNLAKLSSRGGTLTDLCQGSGDTEDDDDQCLDDANLPPFESLRRRMTDLIGDAGVMKLVRQPGAGPQIPSGGRALIHYTGQCEAQDEPFDSTYLRGRGAPQPHLVGPGSQLLPGLNLGVMSMRKGEESLFLIRPEYAYGEMGCQPRIPANSEVLFRVLLVSWSESVALDQFCQLSDDQRLAASFHAKLTALRSSQQAGNEQYRAGEYRTASKTYREAIRIYCDSMVFANEEEHNEAMHVIFKVMSNRTQTLLCLNQWKEAAKQGRQALQHCDNEDENAKYVLYLRLAKAMIYLPEMTEARRWLKRASHIRPGGADLRRMMDLMLARSKHHQLKEVEFARNIFDHQQKSAPSSSAPTPPPPVDNNQPPASQGVCSVSDAAPLSQYDAVFASAEFKRDVEKLLTDFRDNCVIHELDLPFDGSEEAQHKMQHVQRRCQQLQLVYVPPTAVSGPRVAKRQQQQS